MKSNNRTIRFRRMRYMWKMNYTQLNHSKYEWMIIFLVGLFVAIVMFQLIGITSHLRGKRIVERLNYEETLFRQLNISNEVYEYLVQQSQKQGLDIYSEITLRMLIYEYDLTKLSKVKKINIEEPYIEQIKKSEVYQTLYSKYKTLYADSKYFPVVADAVRNETVSFDNSWMTERTYGGQRGHEGTDVMTSNNIRGYFQIVSISDGVVEKKGWLEKGGYRIGIRSQSGCYYYYAHLASYADSIQEGDQVKAGQLLGYMGDTGYSKEEGTTGKFAVHLHQGIYLGEGKQEQSVNPYWMLSYLKRYQLTTPIE